MGSDQFVQLKKLAASGAIKMDTVAYLMLPDSRHESVLGNKSLLNGYENHLKIGGYKLELDCSPQGKPASLT